LESRLAGPWRELQVEFTSMLQQLPGRSVGAEKLLDIVEWFKSLQERVEQAFEAAFDWPETMDADTSVDATFERTSTTDNEASVYQNMSPRGFADDPHILTTNELNPVNSNSFEPKHAAGADAETQPDVRIERSNLEDREGEWSTHYRSRASVVDVPMLMATCPEFGEMARGFEGYIRDWTGVHRAAAKVRPMIAISEHAWNVAQKALGPEMAAAAIALIYDKHAAGEVSSPGGYLRGMVQKAQDGELHIDRSFYGRLRGLQA
ncbi:MAG: replication initiation protein RepC, partial [Pseudomonadota bacterium]